MPAHRWSRISTVSGHFAFWFDSGESIRLVGSRLTHGLAPQQADAEPVHRFIAIDSWSTPLSSKGIIYHSCGIARQNWFTYNKTLDTSGLYWMERQRVIFHSAVAMVSFKRPAPSSERKTEDRADSLRRNTV